MKANKNNFIVAGTLIFIGAFSRLLDFLPNFSPMESIALFGAAYLGHKVLAYLVPLVAMYMSDLVLNNTVARVFFPDVEGFVFFHEYMIYNALGMIAIVALGRVLLSGKEIKAMPILGSALAASAIFFIITNIGSWLTPPLYTRDLTGLTAAFTAAIPFFNTSWISTLLFSGLLFGSFELFKRYQASKLVTQSV